MPAYRNGRFRGSVNSANYRSHTMLGSGLYFDDETDDVARLIRAHGVYDKHEMDWYTKFNRFGVIDPYNAMTTTKEYIFFTKPDLNLLTSAGDLNPDLKNVPFFVDAYDRYKPVMEQLQYSYSKRSGPFVTLISNAVTSGLEMPGVSANTVETASNIYGAHQTYRWSSRGSDRNHEFSLEFEDTKYLEVYMLFKIYDEYENLKALGKVSPTREQIFNRVLHDQMTAYKFVVGEDGMTIIFYARITGVFPLGSNRDAFSDMNNSDGQKLSISFYGNIVKDMDPMVLSSFNRIVSSRISGRRDLDLYDSRRKHVEGTWSSCPYIAYNPNAVSDYDKMGRVLLMWKE